MAQKENLAQNITLEISDLNNKLDEIKSHYVESDKYSIDNNDEVDEFETVDYNLLNKTKLCDDISQNKTISEGNTTNEINYESSFMGNQLEE